MKAKIETRILSLLLCIIMLFGMIPISVFAYWEEPTAEGNDALETTVYDYSQPVGVTMQRLAGNSVAEFGEDGNLGDDFLFVIKSGDRYYAMKDVPASETAYNSIPAVDVTDWVNQDGSLTVPADTLDVAFWRYEVRGISEYGMFVNGREDYLTYTYDYESVDGDDDHYNDAERIYSGEFKIRTFEIGQYIYNPGYWSENGVSGTLNFGGRWSYYISSYNSISLKYELITDLRDNGIGGKEFYFRYLGTDVEYVGDEVEGYLYYSDCRHQGTTRHAEYDAPTCMLKGCEEYWYCENCNRYYKDKAFAQLFGEEMPIIPATGHNWDSESCKNCSRPVPVYSKVTNQAQFDALADDTMYILVAEYNGKYYTMDFSEVYSYMTDSDGDGFYDIHNVDDDSDGIPDYLEFDEGGGGDWFDEPNGVYDYLEWDMDDDGDVDDYDLHEFHIMVCDQHLTDMLYGNGGINVIEIAMNPDGTFSHEEAKKTAEFEMVDVYLAEDYDPEWHLHWENGEMPYHTKCIKQFVIPNYFLSAPSMRPIERMYQQRIYDFGDSSHWGVIFYDSRDEYYSYTDGDMDEKVDADEDGKADPLPFPDVNKEGSVAVFDTFDDIMWILYDEGQMAQLRLRDYNDTISFVTGHDYELDGGEWIDDESFENGGYYDTHDTQACVYLYASAPYDSHTCDFGDWEDDENDRTHTRTCKDSECGKTETETHGWDDGVQSGTANCTEGAKTTYTCTDCGATKTETGEPLDHDWSKWTYDSVDSHTRYCKRECGIEPEIGGHEWGDWLPVDGTTHKMVCDICNGEQTGEHDWDEGVITQEPTEEKTGIIKYTCTTCGDTKNEDVDKLEHIHSWSDWAKNDDKTHIRSCRCNETQTEDHKLDDGVVTQKPTHTETGIKVFTCEVCGETIEETIPVLTDHDWSEWFIDQTDDTRHIRYCICNESQTEPHNFDEGVIQQQPTHFANGLIVYTCIDCEYSYDEEILTTPDHEWSDWYDNGDGTHSRYCYCNASETESCDWDNGVVTKQPTHLEKGTRTYTCVICSGTKEVTIAKLSAHEWSEWMPNQDGTHSRFCACKKSETANCDFDSVITIAPTHTTKGIMTYTCADCGYYYDEEISETTEHYWSEWIINKTDDTTHIRFCECNESQTAPHSFDEGVVTEQPAHTTKGVMTYTCVDCGYSYDEEIPETTQHAWSEWIINKTDDTTHIRFCECNESQTAPHNFDAGVVTEQPTHTAKGVMTYTCADCGYSYSEEIPATTEHNWSEWYSNDDGTHSKVCGCNATETKDCTFDDGVITIEPTHYEEGEKTFTCVICGYTKTEAIERIGEHQWSDWAANGNGHIRECKCGKVETEAHSWSEWSKSDSGALTRDCAVCGHTETIVLDEDNSINTTPSDNAADSTLNNTDYELIDKVLTEEEQSELANGEEIKIYLTVEDIFDEVDAAHKAEAENAAGDSQIGMYLDINLFKQIGDGNEIQVTETNGVLTITITIPDNLINTDESVTRTYRIIRVHEDENGQLITDVIEGVFNPDDNSFTFETDKFSTYALAYADNTVPSNPDIPQTGDNSMIALWIALLCISSLGIIATVAYRRKRAF